MYGKYKRDNHKQYRTTKFKYHSYGINLDLYYYQQHTHCYRWRNVSVGKRQYECNACGDSCRYL
jgi:hypothetical protein